MPPLTRIRLCDIADRPEVVEILRDRAINDPDEQLRQFAQKKLAELEGK